MPTTELLGYIGALTGIAGLVVSIAVHRKVNAMKSLDLRIELGKALNKLRLDSSQAMELLNQAYERYKGFSVVPNLRSLVEKIESERDKMDSILEGLSNENENYSALQPKELEGKLLRIHQLQIESKSTRDHWERFLSETD